MELRIEGLYDHRTIQLLVNDNQIKDLGMHFSPKSFNFLQHRQFFTILEKLSAGKYKFYFNFTGERLLVISHLLQEFYDRLDKLDYISCEVYLEFEDSHTEVINELFVDLSPNILRQINGLYWHYRPDVHKLSEILNLSAASGGHCPLTGLILSYKDLEAMHEEDTLARFNQNFHAQLFSSGNSEAKIDINQFRLGLKSSWGDDYFPSLFEWFDFDFISLLIDPTVEVCFRNVDLTKLGQELGHFRQNSLL